MTIKFTSLSYLQLTDHAVGEVLTVVDLHARKAEMARQADAFIALPGLHIHCPFNYECLWFYTIDIYALISPSQLVS